MDTATKLLHTKGMSFIDIKHELQTSLLSGDPSVKDKKRFMPFGYHSK